MRPKHLCNQSVCRGCRVCADPGPRGACRACAEDKTDARPTRQNVDMRLVHEAGCQKDLPHSGVCYPEDEPTPGNADKPDRSDRSLCDSCGWPLDQPARIVCQRYKGHALDNTDEETAACVCCGEWLDGARPPYCRDCHAKGCP